MSEPDWKRVIVHHSATHDGEGIDYKAIRNFHVDFKGWADVGYHAVVEMVFGRAVTIPGRPTSSFGSHCREGGQNRVALGICLVGNFDLVAPPDALLDEAAETIAGWLIRWSIPVQEIRTHREYKATACPGAFFPINDLRARVARILAHG